MNKKVGIITIFDINFGNRLQNYATQKILTNMGFETISYTIEYRHGDFDFRMRIKKKMMELSQYRYSKNIWAWAKRNRQLAFDDFMSHYLPTEYVPEFENLGDKADYFMLGSDQVWNVTWYNAVPTRKEFFLLTFAKPEQKKCISPSFGIDTLPNHWNEWFKQELQTFESLSVREQSGADLIAKLTGQKAEVLIDPTLMLSEEEWRSISKKPYGVDTKTPYILTYFLGTKSQQVEKDITDITRDKNRQVYNLLDEKQPFVYACGPSEFIYMIANADIILTDSFHACVFAFIFQKPFIVYQRDETHECKMNSRIIHFLKMFHLEHKLRDNLVIQDWSLCDYTAGYKELEEEKQKMRRYLEKELIP